MILGEEEKEDDDGWKRKWMCRIKSGDERHDGDVDEKWERRKVSKSSAWHHLIPYSLVSNFFGTRQTEHQDPLVSEIISKERLIQDYFSLFSSPHVLIILFREKTLSDTDWQFFGNSRRNWKTDWRRKTLIHSLGDAAGEKRAGEKGERIGLKRKREWLTAGERNLFRDSA